MLSHGMKQAGSISIHHLGSVVLAIRNPWVAVGILLLLAFFASYMNALSWADLTYVLPATSLGYVLLALVAKFALHEGNCARQYPPRPTSGKVGQTLRLHSRQQWCTPEL